MLKQYIEIPYKDSITRQYQLKEKGVAIDITGQTLFFYLKSSVTGFTAIEKDIGLSGWFDDPENGIFHVIIDTDVYAMSVGTYRAEIEWTDRKSSLVFLDISVFEDVRHDA